MFYTISEAQILHDNSCSPISTSFALDWDSSPTANQFNWTPQGNTSFTASNIQGSGNEIAFTLTGATATLDTENSISTPGVTNSLSGGVDALHISSSGLTSTEELRLTMTFTPPLAGDISFDIYNIIEASGGGAEGQQIEVFGLTTAGFALIPELTDNGSPSWELEGPGVIDGNATSTAGTNDQVGVNFRSISDISTITITMRRCTGCGNSSDTEFAIGDIDICLTPDTDQDGIPDSEDEDDDNDGVWDVREKCPTSDRSLVDWDNYTYNDGDPSNTYALPDGTNMTVAIASNGASIQAGETSTFITGGEGAGTVGLFVNGNQNIQVNSIDISFSWDQAIDSLEFTIFDIDQINTQWVDSVTIIGFYNGFVVFPALTGSANNNVTTNRAVGASNTIESSAAANVDVAFSEPIDSMIIFYGNGNDAPTAPGNQWISIWDLSYIGDCGSTDTDGDGISDYLDIDADNDGLLDYIEWQLSSATPIAPSGLDADLDGIDDNFEAVPLPVDTDGDGVPDFKDLDSDDDGDLDALEAYDTDNDGVIDTSPAGTDSDLDGLDDNYDTQNGLNSTTNITNNGQDSEDFPNLDGETVERDWREDTDIDDDGVQDYADLDDDNDGILDANEGKGLNNPSGDADGDGIPNWADVNNGGTGGDGSTTNYTDGNADGIPDVFDADNDGVPNHHDPDSDGDGIADIIEAGGEDADGDGVVDGVFADGDGDGWATTFDNDGEAGTPLTDVDQDGDGLQNHTDIDSDDDGIIDLIESQATTATPIIPSGTDSDGDGIDDNFDTDNGNNLTNPVNTESFDNPDYLDINADNDLDSDQLEAYDTNNDGTANTLAAGTDSDNDGLDDNYDNVVGQNATTNVTNNGQDSDDFPNLDVPGTVELDWRETGNIDDNDGDGIANDVDIDDDNDGILDIDEASNCSQVANTTSAGIGSYTAAADGYLNITINGGDGGGGSSTAGGSGATITASFEVSNGDITQYVVAAGSNSGSSSAGGAGSSGLFINDDLVLVAGGGAGGDNSGGQVGFGANSTTNGDNGENVNSGTGGIMGAGGGASTGNGASGGGINSTGGNGSQGNGGSAADLVAGDGVTLVPGGTTNNGNASAGGAGFTGGGGSGEFYAGGGAGYSGGGAAGDNGSAGGGGSYLNTLITSYQIGTITAGTDGGGATTGNNGDDGFVTLEFCLVIDTDNDGVQDSYDPDSDGDGIADIIEAGGVDTDGDGRVDGVFSDADGDGWATTFDNVDEAGTPLTDADSDGDGFENRIDIDSDDDGIIDIIESQASGVLISPSGADTDGDGIDDNFDINSGNSLTTVVNTDGADNPDYTDTDSDNDGDSDAVEAYDTNNDGTANTLAAGTDSDNDGLDDNYDNVVGPNTTTNITNNGQTSSSFPDLDRTGTPERDWREDKDNDDDGVVDSEDIDDDNDGILDVDECGGTVIFEGGFEGIGGLTTNSNNLGVSIAPWILTAGGTNVIAVDGPGGGSYGAGGPEVDARGGAGNYFDINGVGQIYQTFAVTGPIKVFYEGYFSARDGDTGGGFIEIRAGTGIAGAVQSTSDVISNNDNTAWYYVSDTVTLSTGTYSFVIDMANPTNFDEGGIAFVCDTDNDGVNDQFDLDSDGDGIADIIEAGGVDIDGDGIVDGVFTDTDGDGWSNTFDPSDGGTELADADTDGDGLQDRIDLDSDDDGIIDIIESQASGSLTAPSGTDSDGDGIDDNFDTDESNSLTSPIDTDGDAIPDYTDTNSDNDGQSDAIEAYDTDNDGTADTSPAGTDSDNDGLDDNYDDIVGPNTTTNVTNGNQSSNSFPNEDNGNTPEADWREINDQDSDGIADEFDIDDDNDGILDTDEGTGTNNPVGDEDGDGFLNYLDVNDDGNGGDGSVTNYTDANGNGVPDVFDFDDDGVPNQFDLDSDNDGIVDIIEAGGTDADNNGRVDGVFLDADGDGWSTTFDNVGEAGTPLSVADTDGDGLENYLDLDSDNDGIIDNVEGQTTLAFAAPQNTDTDGDGWDDRYDSDNGGTAITLSNFDATGDPDYIDIDADDDTFNDWIEGFDDNEDEDALNDLEARAIAFEVAAGSPGYYVNTDDADADDIPDWLEDNDADGTPNFLDPDNALYQDTDGDGIVDLYDTDNFGLVSNTPDNDSDGEYDFRDTDDEISLPVELLNFSALKENQQVKLSWETATETNNDYFIIERALDGRSYRMIHTESGNGTSLEINSYFTFDDMPASGLNFYRLTQVDFDGKKKVYNNLIKVVKFDKDISDIKLYPNPTSGDKLFIEIEKPQNGKFSLTIYSLKGELLRTEEIFITNNEDSPTYKYEVLRGLKLAKGVYFIRVTSPTSVDSFEFIVQ